MEERSCGSVEERESELGNVEGEEASVGIYCMREELINSKKGKKKMESIKQSIVNYSCRESVLL